MNTVLEAGGQNSAVDIVKRIAEQLFIFRVVGLKSAVGGILDRVRNDRVTMEEVQYITEEVGSDSIRFQGN